MEVPRNQNTFIGQLRPNETNINLPLSDLEESIFDFLLQVVEENNLNTTVRVAGGWVRDKLYGRVSDDIDIALDDMSG